ncbi:MAG TPA: transketolase [Chloroflexota bacterium]|jgi:transketolase|nr:transketolase [Chloroflexota bacterium]
MTEQEFHDWHELGQQLRVDSIRSTTEAGSGHPTSSMSAADMMSVLLAKYFKFDFGQPKNPTNDHFVLSKGHAAPLLYSMLKAAGAMSDAEMLTLRRFDSPVEGHPVPILPAVDVATGSLGQGLPIAVGIALAGKYLDKLPYRVWVLMGDSETAEGSVWEGFDKAAHYGLSNLTAIIDVNRLGQRGQTELGWNTHAYVERARAFGWHAIEIDGHDLREIDNAFGEAITTEDRPVLIVAHTLKGKGVSFVENINGWHGKAIPKDQEAAAIAELGGERHITVDVHKPAAGAPASTGSPAPLVLPVYEFGTQVATRKAYGDALKALGAARPDVVALDGEVSNSTFADEFAKAFPDRYFEMYIAEQQLVAAAVGLQVRGYKPFASTFAAFFSRAYDFVRMAAISRAHLKLVGSHAGVSIGADGPSQMALEDLASMRAVHGSTVLYPSDGNQTAKLLEKMVDLDGIVFMRTTREATDVIYKANEEFEIGGSKVVRFSANDQATIIGAGITLYEALKAHDRLREEGINTKVVDLYSIKPTDHKTLHRAARETDGRLITVEDHWMEGGIGSAVADAFAGEGGAPRYDGPTLRLTKQAVTGMPGSGTPEELLHWAKIDADAIVEAVKSSIRETAAALT